MAGKKFGLVLKTRDFPQEDLVFTNQVLVNPEDASLLTVAVQRFALPLQTYCLVKEMFVYVFAASPRVAKGSLALNSVQRRLMSIALGDAVSCVAFEAATPEVFLTSVHIEVDLLAKPRCPAPGAAAPPPPAQQQPTFSAVQLAASVERQFQKHFLGVGEILLMQVNKVNLTLRVKALAVADMQTVLAGKQVACSDAVSTDGDMPELPPRGILMKNTEIRIERATGAALRLTGADSAGSGPSLFRVKNLDAESLGLGGLDKEFVDIVRRTLASRIFPSSLMEKIGQSHVKGMLLYGPPGTGKTLTAKTISKMLNGKEPKIVAGPELFNKYVGQTEENIRNLFSEAIDEYQQRQDDSDLHVIVIDEIDALCRTRGTRGDGTGVGDSAVNQLLAVMDGVNALNNILVIGMTNRFDMLDAALLRPGRFEVHVEVGLPDEFGRLQILRIHTAAMRKAEALGHDVELEQLARETKNFTGAEIAGLVRSALSFALMAKIDFRNIKEVPKSDDLVITKEHFENALTTIKPAFGIDETDFSRCFSNGVITYSQEFQKVADIVNVLIHQVASSPRTSLISCLLTGCGGCGKTALAAQLAVASGFPFVKLISPDALVKCGSEQSRCAAIVQTFEDAYKSALSIIIIDDIETLLDYVPIGPRFSNAVLQTLLVLVKRPPPKPGRKLFVIGTSSVPEVLREMRLYDVFTAVLEIPLVRGPDQLLAVLLGLRTAGSLDISSALIVEATKAFLPNAEIPVKKLIILAEMALQYADPLCQGGLISGLAEIAANSSRLAKVGNPTSAVSSDEALDMTKIDASQLASDS